MSPVNAIGGYSGYPTHTISSGAMPTAAGAEPAGRPGGVNVGAQAASVAGSSSSVSARIESFVGTYGAGGNRDMVDAILLLIALKLMTSDDKKQQESLAALMLLMMAMQQGQQESGGFIYQSASLSVEQTSLAAAASSTQAAAGQQAYGGGLAGAVGPVPALDVSA